MESSFADRDGTAPADPASKPPGTNRLATASMILGLLGPLLFMVGVLLSIVFGIVALTQIRKTRQDGKGRAVTGLIVSALWIIGLVTAVAISVSHEADRDTTGQITDRETVTVAKLTTGDCVNNLKESKKVLNLPAVPCAEPHEGEVVGVDTLTGTRYPGEEAVFTQADTACLARLDAYASKAALADDSIQIFYLYPTAQSWVQGDHDITCIANDTDGRRTGSLKR